MMSHRLHGWSVANLPSTLGFSTSGIAGFFKDRGVSAGTVVLPEMVLVLASLVSALHVQRTDLTPDAKGGGAGSTSAHPQPSTNNATEDAERKAAADNDATPPPANPFAGGGGSQASAVVTNAAAPPPNPFEDGSVHSNTAAVLSPRNPFSSQETKVAESVASPPNPFTTLASQGASGPQNPFYRPSAPEMAAAIPRNPFQKPAPAPAAAPPNPFFKPQNPFNPGSGSGSGSGSGMQPKPLASHAATGTGAAIRREAANPFMSPTSSSSSSSSSSAPAPQDDGGGPPRWTSPWPNSPEKSTGLGSSAASPNGSTPSLSGARSATGAGAGGGISSGGGGGPSLPLPWHEVFAQTLIGYLIALSEQSSEFREVCSSTKVLEALIKTFFVSGDILTEQPGARSGVVARHDRRGNIIGFRLCEPGGWPLRGKLRLNSQCKTSENVLRLMSNVAMVVFQSAEPKTRAWTEKLGSFVETLLYSAPASPSQDLSDFQEVLSMMLLQRSIDSKAFGRPATVALQQLVHSIGVLAEAVVGVLCGNDWGRWHNRVFAGLVELLMQSVGTYGVKSSFVDAGGHAASKGIDRIYAALCRLVACRLQHAAKTLDAEMIASVNAVVDIRGMLFGRANTDANVGLMLLKELLKVAERAQTTKAPEFLHVLVILFREVHTHSPQLISTLASSYGRPTETTRLWGIADLEPFLLEGPKATVQSSKLLSALESAQSKIEAETQARADRRVARLRAQEERNDNSAQLGISLGFSVSERVTEAKRVERLGREHRVHKRADHRRYTTEEWKALNDGLFRERGIFGHDQDSPLCRWMVDEIEGPGRMRKKFRRNPGFFGRYGGPEDETAAKMPKNKRWPSSHLLPVFRRQRSEGVVPGLQQPSLLSSVSSPARGGAKRSGSASADGSKTASTHDESIVEKEGDATTPEEGAGGGNTTADAAAPATPSRQPPSSEAENPSADTIALRLIEPGDTRRWEVEAESCVGLDTVDGVFFFCEYSAYFIGGCGLAKNGNLYIRASEKHGAGGTSSSSKRSSSGNADSGGGKEEEENGAGGVSITADMVTQWRFEDIKDLRRRRHCLQDKAIELFSADGATELISFPNMTARDKAYDAIVAFATTLSSSAEDSVDGMARDAKLEKAGLLAGLVSAKTITQRWEAGEVSNFEYLMQLNTMAGRSYNDLNQYPVFPWVLADYTSEVLDFTKPETFRDLSKPMGALSPKRAEGFQMRYDMWEDPTGEGQPAFHYGTHYSSAQYVAGYLIRLEPFTQHFISLQGGHFDHPDRLFYSVAEQWKSASEVNSGDVKELLPEFYYLPDFLLNDNKFDFGVKGNGKVVDDVELPPWARGNAQEFIRVHRAALESDYVSAHLHEWIDLIFGFKQQGEEAVKAMNVFHHLTYEGAVDLEAMEDPMQRLATISTIQNFGQTPTQLFKRPHPPRRVMRPEPSASGVIAPTTNPCKKLMTAAHPLKEMSGPVGQITPTDRLDVQVAGRNRLLVPSSFSRVLSWDDDTYTMRSFNLSAAAAAAAASGSNNAANERDDLRVYEGLHFGRITCAVVPSGTRTLITGSSDSTVRVWELASVTGRGSKQSQQLALLQTLCGHEGAITCMAAEPTFSVLVTGSECGICIIWDLARRRYVRQLGPHVGPVSAVCIDPQSGNIVSCSRDVVSVWTVDGRRIAASKAQSAPVITAVATSGQPDWANESLIATGHANGRIRLWNMACDLPPKQSEVDAAAAEVAAIAAARAAVEAAVESGDAAAAAAAEAALPVPKAIKMPGWQLQVSPLGYLSTQTHVPNPQAVTTLAFSKGAQRLFVGDVTGRVFSWGFSDGGGKVAAHWMKDSQATACLGKDCNVRFTFAERRHHCRNCGKVFCQKCSALETPIPALEITKPVRVCNDCYDVILSASPLNDDSD